MSAALVPLGAARERVIGRLSDAFAADLLDMEAFEDRVNRAHRASDQAQLDALVADLPQAPAASPSPTALVVRSSDDVRSKKMRAIFGAIERKGAWSMPSKLKVVAVFGSVELDLREADFAPGETELMIVAAFGSVELIVPPGLPVEMEGNALFGAFEHLERSARNRDLSGPVLRIRGDVFFGAVEVETRLPGESGRQARKRERKEQREITARAAAALPPKQRPDE